MDDRTLLEMAAKAAGYKVRWHEPWGCFVHTAVINTTNPPTLAGQRHIWAPLDDDGDALRLADKLNMAVFFSASGKTAEALGGPGPEWEETDYRRAIVRVAAEIGSQMK